MEERVAPILGVSVFIHIVRFLRVSFCPVLSASVFYT